MMFAFQLVVSPPVFPLVGLLIAVSNMKTSSSSSESDWNTGTCSIVRMSTVPFSSLSSSFNVDTPLSTSTISNSSSHSKYSTFRGRAWKSGAKAVQKCMNINTFSSLWEKNTMLTIILSMFHLEHKNVPVQFILGPQISTSPSAAATARKLRVGCHATL